MGVAWRAPDPLGDLDGYLATALLAEVLTGGPGSRLRRRMVEQDELVLAAASELGIQGEPHVMRAPALLVVMFHHVPEVEADRVLSVLTEELELLAEHGVDEVELEGVKASAAVTLLTRNDQLLEYTVLAGVQELLRGRAEWADELPARLAEVDADQVRSAARRLLAAHRAVLELVPPT
jgi:predicted Zn-dependent peptidase